MKVVFATGIFPPDIGGPATYVNGIGHDFVERKIGVSVVTYGERPGGTTPFPVAWVSRSQSLPSRYWSFFSAVRRAAGDDAVIYSQDPVSAGLPATLAALSNGTPSVLKIVGDLAWEIGREQGLVKDELEAFQKRRPSGIVARLRSAERFVARRAAHIVTPSDFLKRIVTGWGIDPGRIEVIHNATRLLGQTLVGRDEARKRLELESGPLLFTAGRMVPWKGFETLIAAMPKILPRHPDARLLIAGTGPGYEGLSRLVADRKLGDRVQLLGAIDPERMVLYLRASDLFVLASTYEGFSHVLLEAMACGLPVVASRVGGNPELVVNEESGLLVEPEIADIVPAVLRALEDRALRDRLARKGRERAQGFRWETMVEQTRCVLQETTSKSS